MPPEDNPFDEQFERDMMVAEIARLNQELRNLRFAALALCAGYPPGDDNGGDHAWYAAKELFESEADDEQ